MDKEFLDLQKKFERRLKDKEKGVVKNYAASYKRLKKEIEKIYESYEKNGTLSMDDLRKYNRLKNLDADTAKTMQELYKQNTKLIKNSLGEIIDKTWKGSLEALGASGEVPTVKRSFNTDELVHQAVAGRVWTERINHYGNNFIYDVHTIIRKGIEDGDTFTTMAKNLKTRYGEDIGNTVRIARTEGARVQAYTADKVMSEVNKEVKLLKTWRTMEDKSVRHTHVLMEGVTVKFDEEFILPSGVRCMYPKGTGVAAEDINCRCYVEYTADKKEEENSAKTIEKTDEKADNKTVDEATAKKIKARQNFAYDYLKGQFLMKNVEYKAVEDLKEPLTTEEIVKKISGGDKTGGSCSSLAFAYIANKNGMDVIDFRGGKSRDVMSASYNIEQMLDISGGKGIKNEGETELSVALDTISKLEKDKEYYLAAGSHAAIVKRTKDDFFYLELQSGTEKYNGWQNCKETIFGDLTNTLTGRFGCEDTPRTVDGNPRPSHAMAIEVDSFKGNEEFRNLMGHINTEAKKQKKGKSGYEK